jgi:hypothetical protein
MVHASSSAAGRVSETLNPKPSSAAGRVSENWQDVLREAGIVLVHAQLMELVIRQVAQKPPLKLWIVNLIPLLERRSSKEILHKNIIITTVELK